GHVSKYRGVKWSTSVRSFQSRAFDRHVLYFSRGLVHPKMRPIAVESKVEHEVVHIGYRVQIQQELGVGEPPPSRCHRQTIWSDGSEPSYAIQPNRRDPYRVV